MSRPDGSGQFSGGWALLVLGCVLSFVGAVTEAKSYSGIDADALVLKWMLIYIGGGLISAAFLLFITGWIINAISFLPGRDDAVLTISTPELVLDQPVPVIETGDLQEMVKYDAPSIAWVLFAAIAVAGALIAFNVYNQQ